MTSKLLLALLILPLFSFAQINQIGNDIDGEGTGDESGLAVGLSDDGRIVAIGGPENEGNGFKSGHVRVYENSGGNWIQIGNDIEGETTFDHFGEAIGLNANGTIVACGAPYKQINGIQTGHVRVFENLGGTWVQLGDPIEGEGAADNWGSSVAINAEGSIIAIGGYLNNGNGTDAGHVRIYENSGNSWTQIGVDINGELAVDFSGWAVSLNAEGDIVAIGAVRNDGNGADSGHVRVFQNDGGNWIQIGNDIDGEAPGDSSGWSVSLNAAGDRVAIGAPFNEGSGSGGGHVRVYQNSNGTWTQIGSDIDAEAPGDRMGWSVALNASGNTVAIGAQGNDDNGVESGHVRVFKDTGNNWEQIGGDIDGEAANDFSGTAVSISSEGGLVAIGAPFNDENGDTSGHVRIFEVADVLNIDTASHLEFIIHPSPTDGELRVVTESIVETIAVYNQLGQLVFIAENTPRIDLSGMPSGLYFLRVTNQNGAIQTAKVLKR